MTEKKSKDSRRKLLKSIAAGSGAVVAGKSLPESWSKPVINSIVLPAHAELSGDSVPPEEPPSPAPPPGPTPPPAPAPPPALSCIGSQLTSKRGTIVIYDGDRTCRLIGVVVGASVNPDAMLTVDNDRFSNPELINGPGSNWVSGGTLFDVAVPGTYTRTVTRAVAPNAGMAFDVTVTVSTSGTGLDKLLTTILVNIVPA